LEMKGRRVAKVLVAEATPDRQAPPAETGGTA
jgi:hypothetical protein